MHWQGIEKLVGDDQECAAIGEGGDVVMPDGIREMRSLEPAQHRASFDEMDGWCQPCLGHRAKGIAGQRAPARAEFKIVRLWSPRPVPEVGKP